MVLFNMKWKSKCLKDVFFDNGKRKLFAYFLSNLEIALIRIAALF
jgi:hypothetical protein